MTIGRPLLLVASCWTLLLSGCSMGPGIIRCNLLRYNEAVADTDNEQFLLNIVRFRYRDPAKSLAVGSITSSFDFDATAPTGFIVGKNRGSAAGTNLANILAPQAHIADTPTISISPLTGGDFLGGLVTPVPLSTIVGLANTGWDIERLLRVLVHNMNGLENAQHLAGAGGERVPLYRDFAFVAHALGRLQHANQLELATDPNPVGGASLSEPVEIEKEKLASYLRSTDLKAAADSHYLYQIVDNKVVLKSAVTAYDVNLAPDAVNDGELVQATGMLKLMPALCTYRLLPADEGQIHHRFFGPPDDRILVGTRSVISTLLYLSKGIDVPVEQYQKGVVGVPLDEQGRPFDLTQVTEGVFRVCVQKTKPKNAFVAVKYRDYWFYIADNDRSTKSTFGLALELYNVQITRALTSTPVLTVPVSASSGSSGGGRRGGS